MIQTAVAKRCIAGMAATAAVAVAVRMVKRIVVSSLLWDEGYALWFWSGREKRSLGKLFAVETESLAVR